MRHLLTVRETADLLKLTPRAVYARIARGHIPVLRLGRSVRIDLDSLSATLKAWAKAPKRTRT